MSALFRVFAMVWLASLCFGCSEEPKCISDCGLELFGSADCEGFQARENASIIFLSPVFEESPGQVCRAFEGWKVRVLETSVATPVAPSGEFTDAHGRHVAGVTDCSQEETLVGWGEGGWKHTAAVHELAHVIDRCATSEHWGWAERGVFEAIDEANQ